jgi:hypothetical protein
MHREGMGREVEGECYSTFSQLLILSFPASLLTHALTRSISPPPTNPPPNTPQDRKYHAEAGVGLRGITYRAHGEKFWFNPDVVEDVAGERWVYSKRLWCADEGKGKGGK